MTQKYSSIILKQVDDNEKMLVNWRGLMEETVLEEFITKQYLKPFYCMLFRDHVGTGYRNLLTRDFEPDEKGRRVLLSMNYQLGVPIMASFCAFMIEAENIAGQKQDALIMIFQDQFWAYKKVYAVHINHIPNQPDKKVLVEDQFMNKFEKFPPFIENMSMLIDGPTHPITSLQ